MTKTPLRLFSVLCLLSSVLCLLGCSAASSWFENKPASQAVVSAAESAAFATARATLDAAQAKLAAGGSFDLKTDFLQGAIAQARTLAGTAAPLAPAVINETVGQMIPNDSGLRAIAENAIAQTISAALDKGVTKDVAINIGMNALDSYLAQLIATHSSP